MPNPRNSSTLEEILTEMGENYYPKHELPTNCKSNNMMARGKAKAKIESWVMDIIGEDEPAPYARHLDYNHEEHLRNELRAEQRNRLREGNL